jgi:hypothetical protein
MDKYKVSTFLTGLFCKFRVQNKEIRKTISELYGNLIGVILKETSEEKRILIFKSLVPIIKSTADYLENTIKCGTSIDKELFKVVALLISHNTYIIQKVGIRSDCGRVFNDIMKQVFIDDIACNIGECIALYHKPDQTVIKDDIMCRLEVLLADYNVVMGTFLKPEDVLDPKEDEKLEL